MSKHHGQFRSLNELLMDRVHKLHTPLLQFIERLFAQATGFRFPLLTRLLLVGALTLPDKR